MDAKDDRLAGIREAVDRLKELRHVGSDETRLLAEAVLDLGEAILWTFEQESE
jgi:hypothetical protein